MSFVKAWEETLTCAKCGKKMGIVVISSIGTPHQFLGDATCIDCLPKILDEAAKKPELKERVEKIRKWLEK